MSNEKRIHYHIKNEERIIKNEISGMVLSEVQSLDDLVVLFSDIASNELLCLIKSWKEEGVPTHCCSLLTINANKYINKY